MARWKIAGINFDHFHMGDNLRGAFEHADVEIVGLCDETPARMEEAIERFGVARDRVFTDCAECLERTRPDIVILCPASARHGEWVERVASFGAHLIVEKPMAASLAEADAMIAAMPPDKLLAINWPLAWYPSHRTTHRLIEEGAIGAVREVHYYDGNRGPLWHGAHKIARTQEFVDREKLNHWFYKKANGGGSLLDYLGYGTTLGTWFFGGRKPIEVTCTVDETPGLEVDEHSVTVARYDSGLSKFETRWGTFTDPWTEQPQPRCGFVVVGTEGTISSWDYDTTIGLQTRAHTGVRQIPVDDLPLWQRHPVAHVIHCLETGAELTGPLRTDICRIGQQIVDTAMLSAAEKRTVPLLG